MTRIPALAAATLAATVVLSGCQANGEPESETSVNTSPSASQPPSPSSSTSPDEKQALAQSQKVLIKYLKLTDELLQDPMGAGSERIFEVNGVTTTKGAANEAASSAVSQFQQSNVEQQGPVSFEVMSKRVASPEKVRFTVCAGYLQARYIDRDTNKEFIARGRDGKPLPEKYTKSYTVVQKTRWVGEDINQPDQMKKKQLWLVDGFRFGGKPCG